MELVYKRLGLIDNKSVRKTEVYQDDENDTTYIHLTDFTREHRQPPIVGCLIDEPDLHGMLVITITAGWYDKDHCGASIHPMKHVTIYYHNTSTGAELTLHGETNIYGTVHFEETAFEKGYGFIVPLDFNAHHVIIHPEATAAVTDSATKLAGSVNEIDVQITKLRFLSDRTEKKLYELSDEINRLKRWTFWKRLKWLIFGI